MVCYGGYPVSIVILVNNLPLDEFEEDKKDFGKNVIF